MRFALVIAAATALIVPAGMAPAAAIAPAGLVQAPGSDISAAKKKARKKPVPKEQYLRAVPSAPPPATRK